MSSPVDLNFSSFIKIERGSKEALFMQVVYQFINAVNLGLLKDGALLPGSRKLAASLGLHRKTVIAALTELQEQGWIDSVPNIGTFVKNPKLNKATASLKTKEHPPKEAPYHFRRELILDLPQTEAKGKYYFTDGTPDEDVIDIAELIRFYGGVLRRKRKSHFFYSDIESSAYFRDQLSIYLNLTRGFHLSKEALLPISSREKIFSILSRLIIEPGNIVLVGELSYFLPNMIFSQAGAKLKTIPVDQEGIDVDYIEAHFNPGDIRCIYINCLSHYPTTVKLSEYRKQRLLELAKLYEFIIIEDEEDFEFCSVKEKPQSLFKLDGGNQVIYIGALGKYLNTNFQMNFVIAPLDLLSEAKKYLNVFGKTDFMLERALGEMIHEGDILRYQRKSNKTYQVRKTSFTNLLRSYFKDTVIFQVPESGLAFWINFKATFSLLQLQTKALELGLLIPKSCIYQTKTVTALRLGFAHLNEIDMESAIKILFQAYEAVSQSES